MLKVLSYFKNSSKLILFRYQSILNPLSLKDGARLTPCLFIATIISKDSEAFLVQRIFPHCPFNGSINLKSNKVAQTTE